MSRLTTTMLALLLAALIISGCGGSSSSSEVEVAALVRGHGGYGVECVKAGGGGSGAYECTALTDHSNVPVRLAVTVDQSGRSVFVTHCEVTKKSFRGNPCSEIH